MKKNNIIVDVNVEAVIRFQNDNDHSDMSLAYSMGISIPFLSRVKSRQRKAGRAFILGLIKAGMDPSDIFKIERQPKKN